MSLTAFLVHAGSHDIYIIHICYFHFAFPRLKFESLTFNMSNQNGRRDFCTFSN